MNGKPFIRIQDGGRKTLFPFCKRFVVHFIQHPRLGHEVEADDPPILGQVETYQLDPNAATHGSSGPIKVSAGGVYSNVAQQFLDVARAWDTTSERVVEEDADSNDLSRVNVYCVRCLVN